MNHFILAAVEIGGLILVAQADIIEGWSKLTAIGVLSILLGISIWKQQQVMKDKDDANLKQLELLQKGADARHKEVCDNLKGGCEAMANSIDKASEEIKTTRVAQEISTGRLLSMLESRLTESEKEK